MILPSFLSSPFLLHSLLSLCSLLLPYFLNLPVLLLHGLHTYIHPDSLPSSSSSSSSVRAAIRRPSDPSSNPKPKSKSKSKISEFDESKSQLFRLRLADSLLHSRPSFLSYRLSFLLSSLSLSNLSLSLLLPSPRSSPPFSTLVSFPISFFLLLDLLLLSSERSASKKSHKHLSLLSAILTFLLLLLLLSFPRPDLLDINTPSATFPTALLSALLSGALFIPASRAARSFWLATDQLRWNLAVVSCPTHQRVLLYASALANVAAPLLWIRPLADAAAPGDYRKYRVKALAGAAVLQILAVRPNLQTYLNEAVLSWYQRLHAGRVPDLDYGRAKVFLHNHFLCVAAAQFFVPPVLVLVLVGLSQMGGDLFGGVLDCSDAVKDAALFLAWWIVFVWGVVMMSSLALYRTGVLIVS
ncbi:uncharacterized protein M6B38_373265 [Iris pallida]|uniref:Uncharacterized protein n=1 Tax=Iris pallida TaxID=29817 RepID=A0AAX6GD54_IRIPA|nr:uncharacterized protein M6B38_373265 [Iris pallida]